MHIATIIFILFGSFTSFRAAWFWRKASDARTDAGWPCEPGDSEASLAGWQNAVMSSLTNSARLNQKAALWSAISVGLTAVGGVLAS